jgi:hypothetical protein
MKKLREKITITDDLIGTMATINPFAKYNSSPRVAMDHNHLKQAPPVMYPDIPLMLTGYEVQLKVHDISMPDDGLVVSVHKKYTKTMDVSSIVHNPVITIIYQNIHTGEFDSIDIYEYSTIHKHYTTRFTIDPLVFKIKPGQTIKKGYILAHNPTKIKHGIYSTSTNCNVIAIGAPVTAEDGFGVSVGFCIRNGLVEYKTIHRSWGKSRYLLNTYGDKDNFKGFPDIGEKVREDGIIMVFRKYNPKYDALNMSNERLMEIDYDHDVIVSSLPGSTVYDITIESGNGESTNKPITPSVIGEQSEKYIHHLSRYYKELLNVQDNLLKENARVVFSPRLLQLFTRAIADKPNDPSVKCKVGGKITRSRKKINYDEYEISIKVYKPTALNIGAKITNLHACKGIITGIYEDEDMPVDIAGNRADVMYQFLSVVSRLNTGGPIEGFIGAAIRDLAHSINDKYSGNLITGKWNDIHQQTWEELCTFYKITSTLTYGWTQSNLSNQDKINHLNSIIEDTVRFIFTYDGATNTIDIVNSIKEINPPVHGPITYTDFLGRKKKLKFNGLIGVNRMIVLEKSKLEPMVVSSSYRQVHGLPVGPNKGMRDTKPCRVHALRNLSETEVRMLSAVWGGNVLAEYMSFTNDPDSHRNLISEIMTSSNPLKLKDVISSINNSRPVKLIHDLFYSNGVEIVREGTKI